MLGTPPAHLQCCITPRPVVQHKSWGGLTPPHSSATYVLGGRSRRCQEEMALVSDGVGRFAGRYKEKTRVHFHLSLKINSVNLECLTEIL